MPQPVPATAAPATAAPPRSQRLTQAWQQRGPLAWALRPLSWLYGGLTALRRSLYRQGLLASGHPGVPVIVVGNVIAGGAGKTPVTLALVEHLRARGLHPGIVSRGYGRATHDCREARPGDAPVEVGDEPALLARKSGVPVFVARQRLDAALALRAAYPATNVIVCDDGLQHLALQRDFEVCVFNDQGTGNGWLLPAGPLREPWPRAVDAVLHTGPRPAGTPATLPCHALTRQLAPTGIQADGTPVPLANLRGRPVQALAAIARPEDFFAMLRDQDLQLQHTQALPDHYNFESWSPSTDLDIPLICTEKDAVKLWALRPDAIAVPLQLQLPPAFAAQVDAALSLSSPSQPFAG